MRPKTLSRSEEADLVRAYLTKFHQKNFKSYAQLWYESVMEWLAWKYEGARIITTKVTEMEDKVLQHDHLCQEYTSALMKVVLPPSELATLTEHQKMVLLMTASSDEREEALLLIQS